MALEVAAATPSGYWPRRWLLGAGCFLAIFVCYVDRVNISFAILPMSTQYGWAKTTQGWVLSSFFIGYLATQLLGGWLATRIGGASALPVRPVPGSPVPIPAPPAPRLALRAP